MAQCSVCEHPVECVDQLFHAAHDDLHGNYTPSNGQHLCTSGVGSLDTVPSRGCVLLQAGPEVISISSVTIPTVKRMPASGVAQTSHH